MAERVYRNAIRADKLVKFRVQAEQTDLLILADRDLTAKAYGLVYEGRKRIETWAESHPDFLTSLSPLPVSPSAVPPVSWMLEAAAKAGVGPMAAVAGAMAEFTGKGLLTDTANILVENGGDIFLKTTDTAVVGLFAGKAPVSMKLGLSLPAKKTPAGICTSSGTLGHSLSFGRADAATIVADTAALADAAATALGNRINKPGDIEPALEWALTIKGVRGAAVVLGKKIGLLGDLELVPV